MSDDLALPHTAEITARREVLCGWGVVLQDGVNPISQLKWYSSTSPVDKPSEFIFQQVEYKWPHLPSCKVAHLGNLCFLVQQLYALKGPVNVSLSLQPRHSVLLMPRDPEARKGVNILAGVTDLDHVKDIGLMLYKTAAKNKFDTWWLEGETLGSPTQLTGKCTSTAAMAWERHGGQAPWQAQDQVH